MCIIFNYFINSLQKIYENKLFPLKSSDHSNNYKTTVQYTGLVQYTIFEDTIYGAILTYKCSLL